MAKKKTYAVEKAVKEPVVKKAVKAPAPIEVGDTVEVINPIEWNGGQLYLMHKTYTVMQLNGSRAVIGKDGIKAAAVNVKYLRKVKK